MDGPRAARPDIATSSARAPGCGSPHQAPECGKRSERTEATMSPVERVTVLPAALHGRTMRVFVRDLILPARIGVYSHEKTGEQRVRINLELTCVEHLHQPRLSGDHGHDRRRRAACQRDPG